VIASRHDFASSARLRLAARVLRRLCRRSAAGGFPSRDLSWHRAGILTVGLFGAACTTSAPPSRNLVEPTPRLSAPLPDDADLAARDAARALWSNDPAEVARSAARLEAIEAARAKKKLTPTGLAAAAREAESALLPAGPARRAAQARVLERRDVPAELRSRIEQDIADDPLLLAAKRLREDRMERWGGAANEVAEGMGGSIVTPFFIPIRLTQSLVRVALALHDEESLTARERQALKHWKDFVEEQPDAPQAAELIEKIEAAQMRWVDMQVDRAVRQGEAAIAQDEPILAAFLAERALRYRSEDAEAVELLQRATERGQAWTEKRARALRAADAVAPLTPDEWALARALLMPGSDLAVAAQPLLASANALSREAAELALALAARETARESEAWERVEALAKRDSAMGRHAAAMLSDFDANPYRAFRLARREKTKESARHLLFGPLAFGARDHDLPRPLEWLAEVPTLTSVVLGLPSRLMAFPYGKGEKRAAAALARRYLEHHPEGAHASELRTWLREYEDARGNALAAVQFAEGASDVSEQELAELRERAAEQLVAASEKERTRAGRGRLLLMAAERFPETEAARGARETVTKMIERSTPQRIQVSRQYLVENPELAGPRGFALAPGTLDDSYANGELHADGITLIGGRWIELAYVGAEGKDGEAEIRRTELSSEHLARIVALLEESAIHRARVDRDATFDAHAKRETFFERARLGLAGDPAQSGDGEYAFRGMREMYGIVRGRESILPVELVVQSGLEDFGFGAFPRIRMPRETADQILYR
jgi:hypothetical protein